MLNLRNIPQLFLKYFVLWFLCFYLNGLQVLILGIVGQSKLSSNLNLAINFISFVFLILILRRLKHKWVGFSQTDRFFIYFFYLICVFSILKSINIPLSNLRSIPRFIGGEFYFLAWITPLFLFLGNTPLIWKIVWNSINNFFLFFLICSPFLFFVSPFFTNLVLFIPIYLLNWQKLSSKQRYLVGYAFVANILFFLVDGQRNMVVRFVFYPSVYVILLLFENKIKKELKPSILFFFIILLSISFYVLSLAYDGQLKQYFTNPKIVAALTEYERSNFNADSRILVYEDFFQDFERNGGIIIGRGVLGVTFSEQYINVQNFFLGENKKFENVFNFRIGERTELEGGYLMYILKVGVLGLVCMLFLAFRAIYLAFWWSKNKFVKMMGFIIVEWLISMYPYAIPQYSFAYILFWMCIGACLSKKMRNLTDNQIQLLISPIKK
nr:hypothetical protein [uncultured Emticicia sp.]